MIDRHGLIDSFAELFVPIHRDGHKFVGLAAAIALVLLFLWPPLGWLAILLTIAIAFFFRDPDRVVPLRDGLVLAAADGRIAQIEAVTPPPELGFGPGPRTRVSIVLSLIDVHIQRAPVAGRVARSAHMPGSFLDASLDKASEDNERKSTVIATAGGEEIAVVQIAGLIARRIVSFVTDTASIGAGERIGLIRFGSRVDIYLPPGRQALVAIGQRAIAGETIIADLASAEAPREARQI